MGVELGASGGGLDFLGGKTSGPNFGGIGFQSIYSGGFPLKFPTGNKTRRKAIINDTTSSRYSINRKSPSVRKRIYVRA
jgi:hypothetical protein